MDAEVLEQLTAPFWLPCRAGGRPRGRVQVQAQFVQEVSARPLRILLLTWNMGNAAPCENFPLCFAQDPGCADLTALRACTTAETRQSCVFMIASPSLLLLLLPKECASCGAASVRLA